MVAAKLSRVKALGEDYSWRARMGAAQALGELKDPRAIDPLIKGS